MLSIYPPHAYIFTEREREKERETDRQRERQTERETVCAWVCVCARETKSDGETVNLSWWYKSNIYIYIYI